MLHVSSFSKTVPRVTSEKSTRRLFAHSAEHTMRGDHGDPDKAQPKQAHSLHSSFAPLSSESLLGMTESTCHFNFHREG